MYGSLATIIIVMIWIYVCMTLFLFGGVINVFFVDRKRRKKLERDLAENDDLAFSTVEITDDTFDN